MIKKSTSIRYLHKNVIFFYDKISHERPSPACADKNKDNIC